MQLRQIGFETISFRRRRGHGETSCQLSSAHLAEAGGAPEGEKQMAASPQKLQEEMPRPVRLGGGHVAPAMADIIDAVGIGARFALPAEICGGALVELEPVGRARRLLIAMLWLASEEMRRGERVVSRLPIRDLRYLAGFAGQKDYQAIRNELARLAHESIAPEDGSDPVPLFDLLEILHDENVEKVDFSPSEAVRSWFLDPPRFGLVDIRETALLMKGFELTLYQRVRLVGNMIHATTRFSLDDLRHAMGAREDATWYRLAPRFLTALNKVQLVTQLRLGYRLSQGPGNRGVRRVDVVVLSGPRRRKAEV